MPEKQTLKRPKENFEQEQNKENVDVKDTYKAVEVYERASSHSGTEVSEPEAGQLRIRVEACGICHPMRHVMGTIPV